MDDVDLEDVVGLIGPDMGEYAIGKDPDPVKPFKVFALLILLGFALDIFGSFLLEHYRLQSMVGEMNNIVQLAADAAETSFQMTEPEEYLVHNGSWTPQYVDYLNRLWRHSENEGDVGLGGITMLLNGTNERGEFYTPLNFHLTYLDQDRLQGYFKEYMRDLVKAALKNENTDANGELAQKLLMGDERFKVNSVEVNIRPEKMEILDISDIQTADTYTQDVYKYVYGVLDQKVSELNAPGLTDKRYIVVYHVEYKVKWTPYTGTSFFCIPDDSWYTNENMKKFDRNKNYCVAYLQGPRPAEKDDPFVIKLNRVYCVVN